MGGIISSIEPDSIAEDLLWRIGDEIVSINSHKLSDILDYRFYSSEEVLNVAIRRGSEVLEYEFEKDFDLSLGVTFKEILFDGVRTCGAHCIFCFVEQLPKGLRASLYLKDDDFRLSFLDGNFVTLANVNDEDLQRIVTQRLSPLYISVHTTDAALRERMLGRSCPDILRQIDVLAQGNIKLHTQIVLCRGINDGDYLVRAITDLAERYPTVSSIAVVPAGLSAHRRNKTTIESIDAQYSQQILDTLKQFQKRFLAQHGTRLVWAADEFYLSAGKQVPSAAVYEGFPQIENGVGLVRKFKDSAYRAKRITPEMLRHPLKVSIVTGQSAASLLREWANSLRCENLAIEVFPIANELFGQTVTVAGLIAGGDIITQLRDADLGNVVVVPSVAVRDGVFLDNVSIENVRKALNRKVIAVEPRPYPLLSRVLQELAVS